MIPRVALTVAGLAAVALAFPGPGPLGIALTVVGLGALALAVARPWSEAPAVLIVAVVTAWLLTRGSAASVRCIGLAAALTVVHFSAALAAVVPGGAAFERRLLLPWALRSAATWVAGVLLVLATAALPTTPAPVGTVSAAVVVLAGAAVAGWRLVRGSRSDAGEPQDG